MVFSAVTWAYKDTITSAKLAQMVENTRTHDHRPDGTQGDGADGVATYGANSSGPINVNRRAGIVSVNFSLSSGAAWATGATMATLPVGFRPTIAIFGVCLNTSSGAAIRFHVNTNGDITIQAAVAISQTLRGSCSFASA